MVCYMEPSGLLSLEMARCFKRKKEKDIWQVTEPNICLSLILRAMNNKLQPEEVAT